jgi:histidinol-phosphate phosphatase family protein
VIVEPVRDPETGRAESPYRAADVALADGAAAALARLRAGGALLVVVSNQPAAAKGRATRHDLDAVHERAVALLAAAGVQPHAWRYCFHGPADECACRKPRPGLLLDAARELAVDLARSWMVGDSDVDVAAGARAGCRTALLEHPATAHRRAATGPRPTLRASSLAAFAALLEE